jgi:hypothetical protein
VATVAEKENRGRYSDDDLHLKESTVVQFLNLLADKTINLYKGKLQNDLFAFCLFNMRVKWLNSSVVFGTLTRHYLAYCHTSLLTHLKTGHHYESLIWQ